LIHKKLFKMGHLSVCQILVEFNANLEARNDDDDTPMILAVRSEHSAIVDYLCSKGSDVHTVGFDKMDPISYSMNKRNLYMSDVLIKHELRQTSDSASSSFNESLIHSSLALNNSDSVFQED
jgi:ankyrin repeat protein